MANLKRHTIELITEVKDDGDIVSMTYITTPFIRTDVTYEAMDIAEKMEEQGKDQKEDDDKKPLTNRELFDLLVDFTVKLYNKQFTKKDLLAGLHGPDALKTLQEHVAFVMTGTQSEQNTEMTKKFLERKG
ncbi:phage tail assembly chaperone G [Alkalicoccobacillus plakortidis]|uniref:Uncharacterized protein n=1 Tax=Alkalicoccobacillus plakortidis TaxID=444060 RepID=A0ABT0XI81_9BACI|nr:hypothetical protein [Alkalicoccobacillus plakortidis]MCM2675577.1 hypothetical protein [Alkalicoccobacillus plakortidis]